MRLKMLWGTSSDKSWYVLDNTVYYPSPIYTPISRPT